MLSALALSKDGCHDDWVVVWAAHDVVVRTSTLNIQVARTICVRKSAIVRSVSGELRSRVVKTEVSNILTFMAIVTFNTTFFHRRRIRSQKTVTIT